MGYEVELLKYSINPNGDKYASFEINMPYAIHPELLRHRMCNFSSESMRARPTRLVIKDVMEDPYIPDWNRRAAGMQGLPMPESEIERLDRDWLAARDNAVASVIMLMTGKVFDGWEMNRMTIDEISELIDSNPNAPHKGDASRPIQMFAFGRIVVSATEIQNLFFQRVHPAAHVAFQRIAYQMTKLWIVEKPTFLDWGKLHLPYISIGESVAIAFDLMEKGDHTTTIGLKLQQISTARCGRISFQKQNQKDVQKDLEWFQNHIYKNAANGEPQHVSPADHPAIARYGKFANLTGFQAFRKTIPNENHTTFGIEELNQYERLTGKEITVL